MAFPTLILLYSEYSTNCKKLRQLIKDEYLNLFEKVCIDSEEIRQIVLESDNIKINDVPCFLHIHENGTVAKYEATDAFKFITQYISSLTKPTKSEPVKSTGGLPVSSVDKLLSHMKPQEEDDHQSPPLMGAQARKPPELHISRGQPDIPRRGPRRQPFQGITSERDISGEEAPERPVLGEGHGDMMSSLAGMGRTKESYEASMMEDQEEAPRSVTVGQGRHATVIQDITPEDDDEEEPMIEAPSLDDDPSGMGIPRGDVPIRGKPIEPPEPQEPGQMSGRGKGGGSIKALARAMVAARETEDKNGTENRQKPVRQQRSQGKKGVIDLSS